MIKKPVVALIVSCMIFVGCNFSAGVRKNLNTGLVFNYNGFIVGNVLLVGPDNKAMANNKVQNNTQVSIVAIGIANYGVKEGKVFPGMMIVVTDKKGFPVLSAADLFQGNEGYDPAKATELRGDIAIGKPMISGETYHVKIFVWDKVKPENKLNAEADLAVL